MTRKIFVQLFTVAVTILAASILVDVANAEGCEKTIDLVQAIPVSSIKMSHHRMDDHFDKTGAIKGKRHLNNTAERLYINDRSGWHTYSEKVWVELDFGKAVQIDDIVTRGTVHHLGLFWVEKYRLKYRKPADDRWYDVIDSEGNPKLFTANTDATTEVRHALRLTATALRLEATKTKRCCFVKFTDPPHVTGMRIQIDGCFSEKKMPPSECKANYDLVKAVPLSDIRVPHVCEDDRFDNKDTIKVGHLFDTVERIYIDDKVGWETYSRKIWVEIRFAGKTAQIRDIVTRGTKHHLGLLWVEEYRLKYKKPADDRWYDVIDDDGKPKLFTANTDATTIVRHALRLTATALRLEATKTKRCCFVEFTDPPHVTGMRLQIVGCLQ